MPRRNAGIKTSEGDWMKRIGITGIFLFLLACGSFADMFGGTITFKDGGTVDFTRLGNEKPLVYKLNGKLGEQEVRYDFSDLGEIVFANGSFTSGDGEAVVISKAGKRFSLTDCRCDGYLESGTFFSSTLFYTYLDPITNKEQTAYKAFSEVASITIGKAQGNVKKNPTTSEWFPSNYNFDPFTGEKLVWAKRAE